MSEYISLVGKMDDDGEEHYSSLRLLPGGKVKVVGILRHGFVFKIKSPQDAAALANHLLEDQKGK